MNIDISAAYMSTRLSFWTTPRSDDIWVPMAWCGYNAGSGNCYKAQKLCMADTGGACLRFEEIIPYMEQVTGRHAEETRNYVPRNWTWYAKLGGRPL